MKKTVYSRIEGTSQGFYLLMGILIFFLFLGAIAFFTMEHHGHAITGMSNQIVWGTPHVFAILLILGASGVLNVASVGSVFGKFLYKPLARLSALMAITLLLGGLTVLVLDLGRADRLVVAMTSYNFKSIFAWNIFLYNGFLLIVIVYLWWMMERRMQKYYPHAGLVAFVWRLILTTGTGSIFGFLVAREGYNSALLAPMFIAMSLALGLAFFLLVLIPAYQWTNRPLGDRVLLRLKSLLGVFVAVVFYFVLVYHLTNLYITERHGIEYFILVNGGIYTVLFWLVQIGLGAIVPLALLFHPDWGRVRSNILIASGLIVLGGFAQLYVIIVGGQAYPLSIFPGMEVVASSFGDAATMHRYVPSLWELLLGIGGVALFLFMTVFALWILDFLPKSLTDSAVDPHVKES